MHAEAMTFPIESLTLFSVNLSKSKQLWRSPGPNSPTQKENIKIKNDSVTQH